MKRASVFLIAIVITTGIIPSHVLAQSDHALDEIAAKYKACIKSELEASDNGDGTFDEVFFLEGKAHCDKIKVLQIDTARAERRISVSNERIARLTDELISGAKSELGLK